MLLARDVTVRYGARRALDSVRTTLRPGELVTLVGPNGAGKSTLIRVLSGEQTPSEGSAFLEDRPLAALPHRERAPLSGPRLCAKRPSST
ncbi:MAG: ATP-binding cassette domain-containing protein, partial [Myxococcota bacterium]